MSKIYTNNIASESGGNIDIENGVNVSGVITATSFSGDASGLVGIAATILPDSGGTTRVEATTSGAIVTGVLTATTFSGKVSTGDSVTAASFYGDGTNLVFEPKIIAYDPAALSTGVDAGTNITFTFDQNIYFTGTGTINIRETTNSGTIATSFTISSGVPATGLSIVDTQLIINPTENLSSNTVYYVTLPSTGIANTAGTYYGGSNNYNFQTVSVGSTFTATGGDHTFTRISPTSPTGYYRYHIFTSTNPLVLSADASEATDLAFMMVGGGGAGGGRPPTSPSGPGYVGGGGGGAGAYIARTGATLGLPAGTYTVTIGAGGPDLSPTTSYGAPGSSSSVASPTVSLSAAGGGAGGYSTSGPGSVQGYAGGSGGGGAAFHGANTPITQPGGPGIPGEGYPGGIGKNIAAIHPYPNPPTAPNGPPYHSFAGGGGGAGGAGGDASGFDYPASNPTYPAPNKVCKYGGSGGAGAPNPNFTIGAFAGYVPIPIMPVEFLTEVGPTGLYGGGGGGGGSNSPFAGVGGLPGPGGGGEGDPGYFSSTFAPFYPPAYPGAPSPGVAKDGVTNMGAGGGGSSSGGGSNGQGGSGIVLIRYAVDI